MFVFRRMKITNMKPSQLLRERGWCQQANFKDEKGLVLVLPYNPTIIPSYFCAQGAICYCYEYKKHGIIYFKYFAELKKRIDCITLWNDHPERTKEEVIAMLEEVEKELGL